ncbi:hypothetical protein Goshw_029257 [Gossypium schwendimanii]|uniref:Uncharacterized protein n=2 Tax=Gossypium TaxID=3633 RepID=A0A7J9L0I7_GOSSC|nr:hypothetical protein [Gossypium harknessii]MBA0851939.1 hypothetical protein [Gossypium schwendimanii]
MKMTLKRLQNSTEYNPDFYR